MDWEKFLADLKALGTISPAFLANLAAFIEALIKKEQGPSTGPLIGNPQAGTDYQISPSRIDPMDLARLRTGIADGVVIDRLMAWINGLATGLALAGGAA